MSFADCILPPSQPLPSPRDVYYSNPHLLRRSTCKSNHMPWPVGRLLSPPSCLTSSHSVLDAWYIAWPSLVRSSIPSTRRGQLIIHRLGVTLTRHASTTSSIRAQKSQTGSGGPASSPTDVASTPTLVTTKETTPSYMLLSGKFPSCLVSASAGCSPSTTASCDSNTGRPA